MLTIPLFLTLCFYVIYIIRHIRIHRPRFAYSLYNFYWATMTIKGSLRVSIAIVKAILADCWSKIWLCQCLQFVILYVYMHKLCKLLRHKWIHSFIAHTTI